MTAKVCKGITNTNADSSVRIDCDCQHIWSLAQQFAFKRLSTATPIFGKPNQLLFQYNVRARRISATYARFYLETEEHGDLSKKGRYYWMAIAAFASKTVACSLEDSRVVLIDRIHKGLAKGNMWLFYDIAPWHWAYSLDADSFRVCIKARSADSMAEPIRDSIHAMSWSPEALPKIGNLKCSDSIVEGFEKVREIESKSPLNLVRTILQIEHLMAIAKHEQLNILQPLIYDDPDFAWWVKTQRSAWVNWASPQLKLVFAAACDTDDPELESVAPGDTQLEIYKSRMKWIAQAANKFHGLMQKKTSYMESQLQTMASWADQQDRLPAPRYGPY